MAIVNGSDRAALARLTLGMVWIEGGEFQMGSDAHYPEEAPAHRVRVDGFFIDPCPVTNRQFAAFVFGRPDGLAHHQVDEQEKCSHAEENQQIIQSFVSQEPAVALLRTRELLPWVESTDGAFVATLRRS